MISFIKRNRKQVEATINQIHVDKYALQWRHNGLDGVSNHQHHHCLLNLVFRRRSKKTSKLRVTGLCAGNSPGNSSVTGEFPAQKPITLKMFPFDEVIMKYWCNRKSAKPLFLRLYGIGSFLLVSRLYQTPMHHISYSFYCQTPKTRACAH